MTTSIDSMAAKNGTNPGTATFRFRVNERDGSVTDPVPLGRQVLEACRFVPADEHVLIQLLTGRTQSIGLDEEIDLRAPGTERFHAFRSDRIFRFTLNGAGYEWGNDALSEGELRELAQVPADQVLILEHAAGPDLVLNTGDVVSLATSGTERLRTASRFVLVILDDEFERSIPRGSHTTEELLKLLEVRAGYVLNVLNAAGELQPLAPGQPTFVEDGMKFYSQAPCGGAS